MAGEESGLQKMSPPFEDRERASEHVHSLPGSIDPRNYCTFKNAT